MTEPNAVFGYSSGHLADLGLLSVCPKEINRFFPYNSLSIFLGEQISAISEFSQLVFH